MSAKATDQRRPVYAWIDRVQNVGGPSAAARSVAAVVARYMREENGFTAWPSVATIGLRAGLNERTVRRSLQELVVAGWLAVDKKAGRVSRYRLTFPAEMTADSELLKPVTSLPDGYELSTTPVTMSAHPGHNVRRIR